MFHRMLALVACAGFASTAAAQGPAGPPLTAAVRASVVDSLAHAVETYYVFPDSATGMAWMIRSRLRSSAYDSIVAPAAFAGTLTRDLQRVHHDVHLRIVYEPQQAAAAARPASPTQRAFPNIERERRDNFWFHDARVLPGNVGYIQFSQFPDTSAEARGVLRAAMQFVAHADALIIDLRENRGGSVAMWNDVASYFVRDSAHWTDSYDRISNAWRRNMIVNRRAITGGTYLGMPIAVLTSGWTFSAGEGLAYELQHNRGAIVVGDTTAGGAHVLRRVLLGNGFIAFVPYARSVNVATGTDWEGTGVVPDVHVHAADALAAAEDTLLATRRAGLESKHDTAGVRAIDWATDDVCAHAGGIPLPAPDALASFTGMFAEYVFFVKDGWLYSRNTARNDKVDRMWPIAPSRFTIDPESHAEFVRDSSGAVTAVRLLWNDGWVDVIPRSK